MFKRILVAYDGSEQARRAMDYAVDVASSCKAALIVLTVVPKITIPVFPDENLGSYPVNASPEWADYQERLGATYKKSLDEAVADVKKHHPKLPIEADLLEGRPSATIVEEAERRQADLIVIGSRGIGGISGWLLGSTSRRVVESCTKPVLVIK